MLVTCHTTVISYAAYAKLLAHMIRLRAHYPDHPIKSGLIMLREFTSKAFDDYCMCIPRMVLQMVMRTLVMRTNLPPSAWVHAVLHTAMLIRLRLIATQSFSTQQLVTGYESSISYLRIFGCAIYVPITLPQRTKWVLNDE